MTPIELILSCIVAVETLALIAIGWIVYQQWEPSIRI